MTANQDRVYCTYFDQRYLARGRAMIRSLRAVGEQGEVVVLALDDVVAESNALGSNVRVVTLDMLEARFPQLLTVKAQRSPMEYVFTITPWLTLYALELPSHPQWATYLDADLYFFSSCEPIYLEMGDGSVGIVPHRFGRGQRWRLKYGVFNVAWVSFRDDIEGRRCLEWWADRCLDWCFDAIDNGRFADQGYLDIFPSLSDSVTIIRHPGVDLAPWNLSGHQVSGRRGDVPRVDGSPLVFFHFHGLDEAGGRFYFKHLPYLARSTPAVREGIYRPYCVALGQEAALPSQPHQQVPSMARHATTLGFIRWGRQSILRVLARARGDYLDL